MAHYATFQVMTGKQFRAWRKRMRLKLQEAADQFGVSRATISRWETEAELPAYVERTCAAVSMNLPKIEG